MTHGTFACMDNDRNYPEVPSRRTISFANLDLKGRRAYEPFPPFHVRYHRAEQSLTLLMRT